MQYATAHAFRAAMKHTVCCYQGWIVGEANEAVASRPPFFERCRGAPFESFALSFCIALNLVHKLKCETFNSLIHIISFFYPPSLTSIFHTGNVLGPVSETPPRVPNSNTTPGCYNNTSNV